MNGICVRLLVCFAIGGAPIGTFGAGLSRSCAQPQFRGGPDHRAVYCGGSPRHVAGALWKFATGGPVESSPAVADEIVYFGSGDGRLYAAELSTGREIWHFDAGGAVDGSPAVDDRAVYVTSRNRRLFAVDRAAGRQIWSVSFGGDLPFSWGYEVFLSSPAVDGGSLYVGAGDGCVYRIASADGKVIWKFPTGGRVRSSPAVAGGVVYAGSFDGVLYAIDASSGKLEWKYATEGAGIDLEKWGFDRRSINSSPAASEGVVTFGSRDAHQYALDAASGRLLWRIAHPVATPDHAELAWCEGSPAIEGGVSYVGSSDGHFVDAVELKTGRELWRHPTAQRVIGSPAVSGDLVVAGGEDGMVFALDRKDGHPVWSFPTRARVYSSPAVAGARVFIGSADGSLYALADKGPAAAAFLPRRAVYWDAKLSGWFAGAAAVRDYLASEGYELLDAAALPGFLEDRVSDGIASAVVFASDEPPSSVTAASGGVPSLISRYLDSGGRAVWVGFPPFALKYDEATGKRTGLDPAATRRILGVGPEAFSSADAEDRGALPTPEGIGRGLPRSWMGSFPVPSGDVDAVLARDAEGMANAWAKRFGKGEFIRVWGLQSPIMDLEAVRRVAEHGLPASEGEGAR
jgi:outer membrane protein assembly factor BamB